MSVCENLRLLIVKELPWFHNQLFKMMQQLANIKPSIVMDILPALAKSFKETEEKRGGMDASLR